MTGREAVQSARVLHREGLLSGKGVPFLFLIQY